MENAWQKVQVAVVVNNSNIEEQVAPALLTYYKLTTVWLKNDAMQEAQEKLLDITTEGRCRQLEEKSKGQLAHEYLLLSTAAYDVACQRRSYKPESSIRGTHIHQVAESLARIDRARAEQCPMTRYPFDGIEQCYFFGDLAGFGSSFPRTFLPCGAKPDLIDTTTGEIFDYKTGSRGTDLPRHRKNSQHVPQNTTGKVSSHDVTVAGVQLKYSSSVSLHSPTCQI